MAFSVLTHPRNIRPQSFGRDRTGWLPWLIAPAGRSPDVSAAGSARNTGLLQVLAHDPASRAALIRIGDDIFHGPARGLPRGERALAATAAARRTGCFTATAAHARQAVQHLRREREIGVLLEDGLPSPLGGRLGAVIAAASALTGTPSRLTRREIWALDEEKLDDQEILDVMLAAAFAVWESGLNLSLGEPAPPAGAP